MVILNGLLLEFRAIFGFESEAVVARSMGAAILLQPGFVVLEQRFVAEGSFAVRPARGIHLKQAEVHAQLNLLGAVFGFELSDGDLTRLVIPLLQEVRDVEIHAPQYGRHRLSSQRAKR